jgi:GLPGLI family protein
MKNILFLSAIILPFFSNAQMKEGKVLYERTIQMQFRGNTQSNAAGGETPPPPPPGMENMPRERKDKFELSFANNQSLWENVPEIDDNDNIVGDGPGGGRMFMRVAGGDNMIYHNFTTGKRIDEQELNARKYIVEDSIQKIVWKMTGQTKTILGHTAQKVSGERYSTRTVMTMENGEMKRQMMPDTSVVNAWIAMDIPVPGGPEQFQGQLPGLILELEMNNGRMVYRALEISSKVNASAIKEPKGGKRITAAEFTKLRDKEFEEMRRNMPTGGGRRIQLITQ